MRIIAIAMALVALLGMKTVAYAAVPDGGSGPFADVVGTFSQGTQKGGAAVLPERSDPNQALGDTDNQFVSLGVGGELVLEFQNPHAIVDGIHIEEVTNQPYDAESVDVWMSANGVNWYYAGDENFSGDIALPDQLECARFVKLVDATDYASHASNADGYDIDSVESEDPGPCDVQGAVPTPTPTIATSPTPGLTPNPTQPITPPNPDPTSTPDDDSSTTTNDSGRKSSLSRNGPSCGSTTMNLTMELKENDKKVANVEVTFRYNGEQKVVKTNNDGYAGTSYGYTGKGEVTAEANGWPTQRMTLDDLDCSGASVLGVSTDNQVGGQVLGSSTDTLAQTGRSFYGLLAIVSASLTLLSSAFWMRAR